MDVREIDAASNRGIDDIRDLREKIKYSPAEARYKVYILDEAHMLTPAASNALLKTLEEPPSHSFFILATTEPHKMLPTILSRCQRFDFRPIPVGLMVEALRNIAQAEGIQVDDAALAAIAQAADGAMRNAESIFDQVIAYQEGPIDLDSVNAVLGTTDAELLSEAAEVITTNDVPGVFAAVDELVTGGKDLTQFLADLTGYFENLLRISLGDQPPAWLQLSEARQEQMRRQAQHLGATALLEIINSLAEAQQQLRGSTQPALIVELALCAAAHKHASGPPTPTAPTPPAPATEPAPEKQPAPPTAVAEGPLTLEMVQACWPQLNDQLKRDGHMPIGAIIMAGQPAALDGQRLVVAFDDDHQFHYNRIKEQYGEVIEKALEKVVGQRLNIQCRLGATNEIAAEEQAADETQSPPPPPTPAASETDQAIQEAVDQTLQLFEGSKEITEQ